MNYKINPISFRLGVKNNWKIKFFENKKLEIKNFSFYQLELQNFLISIFKKYKLNLLNLKIFLKRNSLNIFILYNVKILFNNNKNIFFKNVTELCFLKNFYKKGGFLRLKNFYKTNLNFNYLNNYFKFISFLSKQNLKYKKFYLKNFKLIKYYEKTSNIFLNFINLKFKKLKKIYVLKTLKNYNKNFFLKKIFVIINNFFKNNVNTTLTLKQLNKNYFINLLIKKRLLIYVMDLKKFKNNSFFKFGINLFFYAFNNKLNISTLISKFLVKNLSQLKNSKNLNIMFKFLTNVINLFIIKFNKIKSVEIQLKGNFVKNQKAMVKNFIIGKKVSKLSIKKSLDFNKDIAYTKKGTFGLKIWIY